MFRSNGMIKENGYISMIFVIKFFELKPAKTALNEKHFFINR